MEDKSISNETKLTQAVNKEQEEVGEVAIILDENVSSTVTSSNFKDTSDNQSSCHAIKISSAVSLPKEFFDGNFDEIPAKNNSEKSSDGFNQQIDKTLTQKDTDVIDINSSSDNVANSDTTLNELNVPDSTMTSPKELDTNVLQMVANIKKEPVDVVEDITKETTAGVRVKTEPEEVVDEQNEDASQDDEVDLTTNKCTLCNYVFSSNNSLMRHLQSRKHLRRTLPPDTLKIEVTRADPVLNNEILPDNSVRSTRLKSKGFKNLDEELSEESQEGLPDDYYFCRICNRNYFSASELKRHNRSMKHMRNLSFRAVLKKKANRQLAQSQHLASLAMNGGAPSRSQKDYICPMENCSFVTRQGAILLEHMVVHGIRNNSKDVERSQMMESEVPHAVQKIYCKCKQSFTNNSEYLFHLKVCRFMTKLPNVSISLFEPPPPQSQPPPQQPQLQSQQQQQTSQSQQQQSNKKDCELCDLTFTSYEVYMNHVQIYHKGSSLERNAPTQRKSLSHSGKLWTQVVNKAGEILYDCIICHKKFKQHFSLNSHLRQHKQPPMRRDVCKICNKIFSNSKFFEKHVRGHFLPPNSRKLFCFKCYKTFDHRGEIIAHRATCNTMRLKLYSCNICKQSFKDTILLKEHKLRMHTSVLPVQALCTVDIKEDTGPISLRAPMENKMCHLCNKSFYNFQNMKRHCLTVHRNEDISFLELGPFPNYDEPTTSTGTQPPVLESQFGQDKWDCEFCKKEFRSERLLIYHIEHHCPYLQHIPNNAPIDKLPVEKPQHYKHRCIICAKFLPSFQNQPNTICTRCMTKFEGNPMAQEEAIARKAAYLANQAANQNLYQTIKQAQSALTTTAFHNVGEAQLQISKLPPPPPVSQSKAGKFFQCPIGKKLFTTEAWMLKHFKSCDGSCPSYINCAKCNLNYKSAGMFENHVQKCQAGMIKRFDCSYCGKTYSKRDYIVKHKQMAHKKQIRKRSSVNDFMEDEYVPWGQSVRVSSSTRRRSLLMQPAEAQYEQTQEDEDTPEINSALLEPAIEIVPSDESVLQTSDNTMKDGAEEDINRQTYPCDGCARVFNSYRGLANHSVVHNRTNTSDKSQFECKFCHRGDLLQSQIYSHTYRCIKYLLSQEPVVSCKDCKKNFNTSQQTKEFSANLISHVFDCYDIPYYRGEDDGGGRSARLLCYICCYAFTCPNKLRFHKAEHCRRSQTKSYSKKNKRKFRSELENSDNSTKEFIIDLQPPRKVIRDAKLFKCKVCNRQFFSINKLHNHEKVHGIIQKSVYSEEIAQPSPASSIETVQIPTTQPCS